MEDRDFIIGMLAFGAIGLLLFTGLPYGGYRYGRYVERKELTENLIKELSIAVESGMQIGFDKCKKELQDDCELLEHDGRY